jgi:hypothetical protein
MSRYALNRRLIRLDMSVPKKPEAMLAVGSIEDAPKDFNGTIIVTGVPRPEDKLHRQCG